MLCGWKGNRGSGHLTMRHLILENSFFDDDDDDRCHRGVFQTWMSATCGQRTVMAKMMFVSTLGVDTSVRQSRVHEDLSSHQLSATAASLSIL